MIKLIIFDLDGPILDSLSKSQESVLQGIKKLIRKGTPPQKVRITEETFVKHWGYPGLKTSKLMFPTLNKKELTVITDCWRKNELKGKIPLVRGALKTLKTMRKKGFFTALLTARFENLEFHLRKYSLENLFDIVQSWRPATLPLNSKIKPEKIHKNHIFCHHHKPDPRALNPILKWARKRGIFKKEMVMIDDTLVGLEAAKNSNILFLGVCTGPMNSKEKWQKFGKLNKNYVISSIAELPGWLKKCAGT